MYVTTSTCTEGRRLFSSMSVCLCVCLLDYLKSYEQILMKFFGGWGMVAVWIEIHVQDSGSSSGIFESILYLQLQLL